MSCSATSRTSRHEAFAVRMYFHPLVRCIWIGTLIMFLGGAVSLSDRRLRIGAPVQREAARRGSGGVG